MGLNTHAAGDIGSARALLASESFDLCLTDMRLPDGNGIELVEFIQSAQPQLPVAMITAYGSMDTAIQALKAGAFDFVTKPVDLTMLRDLVNSALKLSQEKPTPKANHTPKTIDKIIGLADASKQLVATIKKVARSQAPVFIHGESGSGKELVARSIHEMSPRSEHPFIAVNCGAIPAELVESEFFGHVKGSFTGAIQDKEGLFQAASGGTLFLDEVADLPLVMQVKLLRAIQERAIKPVGAHHEIPVDVRILSATHKDLDLEMQAGHFRQDLYFRINVIRLDVPPLRERREDLPVLVKVLLAKLAENWGIPELNISDQALKALLAYRFPGNVRELENILERAATLCENQTIEEKDLNLNTATPDLPEPDTVEVGMPDIVNLQLQEKALIEKTLEETRWNRTEAAKKLGLTLRQLRYRIEKLGLKE
jgi:two-component system response regulator PilR (NtrC family)